MKVIIPPLCEVVRHFQVGKNISLTEDQVLNATEVSKVVMISRAIFNPTYPLLRVINTTSQFVKISNILPESQNLSNFAVYSIDKVSTSDETRKQKIAEIVKQGVPSFAEKELLNLCNGFTDIFGLDTDTMTVNNFYEQKLRVKDDTPVFVKNYRLPQTHKAEINRQVHKLLESNLIEPSFSDYNSPLILVPKTSIKGQKRWRMCVDYRLVNKKLIADKYPLPRIDEILDSLGRAKYFSVLDLLSGFWQIPLHEASRDITSFSTSEGSYKWKVLLLFPFLFSFICYGFLLSKYVRTLR